MKGFNTNSKVVLRPNNNDVLCGRGSRSYCHPGNIQFRKIVSNHKHRYNTSDNKFKPFIAEGIVNLLKTRSPPGRYLSEDKERRIWYEISHNAAIQKTQQALREKTKWTKNDGQTKKADERVKCITSVIRNQPLLSEATPSLSGTLPAQRVVSIENKLNEVAATEDTPFPSNPMPDSSYEMKSNILRKEIYLLDAYKNRIIADGQSLIPSCVSKPKLSGGKDFSVRNSRFLTQYMEDYLSQAPIASGILSNDAMNGSMVKKMKDFNTQFRCSKFMYQILQESLTDCDDRKTA